MELYVLMIHAIISLIQEYGEALLEAFVTVTAGVFILSFVGLSIITVAPWFAAFFIVHVYFIRG